MTIFLAVAFILGIAIHVGALCFSLAAARNRKREREARAARNRLAAMRRPLLPLDRCDCILCRMSK